MAAEDPPVGTPASGGTPQSTPEGTAGSPPATPPSTAPTPGNDPSGSAGPRPVAEINLADQPELDRSPQAFGTTIAESKKTADAGPGGGAPSESPYIAFTLEPYDPNPTRDATRQTITLWLIGLLCAIVGLTFVALFSRGASTGFTDKEFFHELKQILDVLLGPVITLLASAVGFYFGYKQGELGQQARNNRTPT